MSPRIPARHDQPVTPMVMTEAAIMQFQHDITTGYDGRAQWRREGDNERLDLWLHPDVVHWLPPGVYVEAVGNRYDRDGFVQFRLRRDWNSAAVKVVRAGVRETTLRPEGGNE